MAYCVDDSVDVAFGYILLNEQCVISVYSANCGIGVPIMYMFLTVTVPNNRPNDLRFKCRHSSQTSCSESGKTINLMIVVLNQRSF